MSETHLLVGGGVFLGGVDGRSLVLAASMAVRFKCSPRNGVTYSSRSSSRS